MKTMLNGLMYLLILSNAQMLPSASTASSNDATQNKALAEQYKKAHDFFVKFMSVEPCLARVVTEEFIATLDQAAVKELYEFVQEEYQAFFSGAGSIMEVYNPEDDGDCEHFIGLLADQWKKQKQTDSPTMVQFIHYLKSGL